MKKLDLTNCKFYRLLVIKEISKGLWECNCDCGSVKTVSRNKLRSGAIKSCGCLNMEKRRLRTAKMTQCRTKYSPSEASAQRIFRGRYSDGNLSFQQFLALSSQDCYYCGSAPLGRFNESAYDKRRSSTSKAQGNFVYNGLDRIDQTQPHNSENVVPCCKVCNFCKGTMSKDQFINHIEKINQHLKGKNDNA